MTPGRPEDLDADEQFRWRARPLLAAALKLAIVAIPVLCSLLAAWLASSVLPAGTGSARWGFRALTVGSALVTAFVAERAARRLLPLTALLKLSLLFPDQAPSRFKVARRATSAERLDQLAVQRKGDALSAATTIVELLAALARHDKRTRGHAERVRVYTDLLADQLRLGRDDQDRLRWAALLHDIGKLAVDPAILNKPGKPSEREWEILRAHPLQGARAAAGLLGWLGDWGAAIAEHHERYDGSGYPEGLAEQSISRGGRMIAVVDAYEVMTAARSYKRPTSTLKAREELARCAGTHFDPAIVRAFLAISLPRLLWATGPLSFLVQLPFIGALRNAGTKLAAAGGPAVAAATGVVVVASATVPGASLPHARTIATAMVPSRVAAPAKVSRKDRVAPRATPVLAAATYSTLPPGAAGYLPPPPPGPAPLLNPSVAAPTVLVTSGPVPSSSATSATIEFLVSDAGATVSCSLDGAPPTACSSRWTAANLPLGAHVLTIAATNDAGSGQASYPWTVTAPPPPPPPGAAPTVTVNSGPTATTGATDATVDFSVSDPAATVTCSLDGVVGVSCSPPWTATNLAVGPHTLTIAAWNAAGFTSTSYSWTVAAPVVGAPTVAVTGGPVPSSSATDATVTFAVSDPAATVTCSLDGSLATSCGPSWTASNLPVGTHTLTVAATNAGGSAVAVYTWDVTAPAPPPAGPPSVSVTGGPTGGTATDATVTFSVSDPTAVVTCSLDGAPAAACTSPWSASNLPVGTHTLTIAATTAGGTGTATHTWTVSAPPVLAPSVVVTSGPVASSSSTSATIGFSVSDPAATVSCSLDGGTATVCANPWSAATLPVGAHTLVITATNAGGSGSASYSWTITAPALVPGIVLITQSPPSTTSAKTATFAWTTGAGLSYECSLDGAPFTACTSPVTYSTLKAAVHTFSVRSVAGLLVGTATVVSWRVT